MNLFRLCSPTSSSQGSTWRSPSSHNYKPTQNSIYKHVFILCMFQRTCTPEVYHLYSIKCESYSPRSTFPPAGNRRQQLHLVSWFTFYPFLTFTYLPVLSYPVPSYPVSIYPCQEDLCGPYEYRVVQQVLELILTQCTMYISLYQIFSMCQDKYP